MTTIPTARLDVDALRTAYATRDAAALLALYADDATHTSPKIRVRHPETGGLLKGKAAMRTWFIA